MRRRQKPNPRQSGHNGPNQELRSQHHKTQRHQKCRTSPMEWRPETRYHPRIPGYLNSIEQPWSLPEAHRFDRLVSSRKPFGLETKFKGHAAKRATDDLTVYQNGGTGYAPRTSITSGVRLIDAWKVFVGRAAPGTGNRDSYPHRIISTPFVAGPGTISSETYLCIGPFATQGEAESALSYLHCRLTRLLILLHKPSQDTTRKVYTFVPAQDWTRTWTDADLYTRYGLSEEEIAFVEKIVRPMGPGDETSAETSADDIEDD